MTDAAPTPSDSSRTVSRKLRILTLNVWGLAFFSKARHVRIPAISARLAASDYDVVALQEIWCESSDWKELRSRCSARFPYSKFFYSGAFGSGLAILSRYPIVASHTHPYTLNGHPVLVHHGDWVVAKAAGCATLNVEGLGPLDVWVTHTVAAGGEDGPESRRAHRVTQAYELARFVRTSAERGHHVICLGDFNSTPPSLSIAILRDIGQLTDAYLQSHPQQSAHAVSLPDQRTIRPDPRRSLVELGITCDSPINTWTAGKPLDETAKKGAGKRLDYIFFRGPSERADRVIDSRKHPIEGNLKCIESHVCFVDLIEGAEMSFSDHFGLDATFEILKEQSQDASTSTESASRHNARVSQTLTSSLSALAAAVVASRRRQQTTFLLFLSLLVLAFFSIGFSATSDGGASSAFFTFVAVICGWTGSTALYSALIWGEWEKRSFRTFLEAMELELNLQRGEHSSPTIPQVGSSPAASPRIGQQKKDVETNPPSQLQQRLINVDGDSD